MVIFDLIINCHIGYRIAHHVAQLYHIGKVHIDENIGKKSCIAHSKQSVLEFYDSMCAAPILAHIGNS